LIENILFSTFGQKDVLKKELVKHVLYNYKFELFLEIQTCVCIRIILE